MEVVVMVVVVVVVVVVEEEEEEEEEEVQSGGGGHDNDDDEGRAKKYSRGLGFRGEPDVLVEMLVLSAKVVVCDCKLRFIMWMVAGF